MEGMPDKRGAANTTGSHIDWWLPLVVVLLLSAIWAGLFKRAADDDERVIGEAFSNQANVAHSMANHTDQLLIRLRFYAQVLSGTGSADDAARATIVEAVRLDRSLLRVMYFRDDGQLVFSTGRGPEPWLLNLSQTYAVRLKQGSAADIEIGRVPEAEYAQAWRLPIILRGRPDGARSGFVLALVDLVFFSRRFEDVRLGRSGEIVLAAQDGRELFRLREGRLEPVGSIGGSARFARAFDPPDDQMVERVGEHDRLYATRHIPDSPLAVLVSRTRDDVLREIRAVQRGYFGSAILLTLVMAAVFVLWWSSANRRRDLIRKLSLAQERNLRLIEEIGKEKEAAYRMATYDVLTGLPNRMLFADLGNRYISRASRLRGRFAVLFIDLDRFKPINDTWGHKAGDQLLIDVARRLQDCMRQTDVVSRYGGDEFVALIADLHATHDAGAVAEKIIASLSAPFAGIVDVELRVTPSVGIACYPDDSTVIDTLVRRADAAMYEAKERGRATYAFADPALNRRIDRFNEIEVELPRAIAGGEIVVHYQPKVSLADYRITGLEALARWTHPRMGAVSPADFIPVAENCGAIVALGEQVIRTVCRQLEAWRAGGLPLVPVAVNVSARQLRAPEFFDQVLANLERCGIEPGLLEIEITETGLVDAQAGSNDVLGRFARLGIRLAIDDFGTGYSGLSRLRALPVSALKIDRSFVKDIRNATNDAAIVSNTISLSHNLHLTVIAEGVETLEQVAHLKAARCDEAQGFLFSPALRPEEIEPLLRRRQLSIENESEMSPE